MTTVAEILALLRSIGQTTLDIPGPDVIFGVATDEAARGGELAWTRHTERIAAFGGTLLLGPVGFEGPRYVPCIDPKAAIIAVIEAFFGHLTVTSWQAGPIIGSNVTLGVDVEIGPNTCIANARIADGVRIGANCSIGLPGFGYSKGPAGLTRFPHLGRVVIEAGVEIGSNTCIDRGTLGDTVIGPGCKIDNLVHIAHNVVLGRDVAVIANAMIGGSTRIGDGAWVAPSVAVMDAITIGEGSILGLGATVTKPVPPREIWVGNPARLLRAL